ncbi:MAG: hypothetical protein ACI33O_14370, partial [Bhargavaea sp.]
QWRNRVGMRGRGSVSSFGICISSFDVPISSFATTISSFVTIGQLNDEINPDSRTGSAISKEASPSCSFLI